MSHLPGTSTENISRAPETAALKESRMSPALAAQTLRSPSMTVIMEKMGLSPRSVRASSMSSCTGLPSSAIKHDAGSSA